MGFDRGKLCLDLLSLFPRALTRRLLRVVVRKPFRRENPRPALHP